MPQSEANFAALANFAFCAAFESLKNFEIAGILDIPYPANDNKEPTILAPNIVNKTLIPYSKMIFLISARYAFSSAEYKFM